MGKFKVPSGKSIPPITTASIPDIIFMLLFFFMVTTVMRDKRLLLYIKTPTASELTKMRDKSLVNFIHIGKPKDEKFGNAPVIQLNDKISSTLDIPFFVFAKKGGIPENKRGLISTSIKSDIDIPMGIIQDVKLQLRKCNQLKLNYIVDKSLK